MEFQGIRGRIVEKAPMKRYTSMKVGGLVPYLFYPEDEADVTATMGWLRRQGLPIRFLGNGTNVIVADKGMDVGLIRITRIRHLRFRRTTGGALVEAAGGLPLKALIKECCRRGLGGLEKLYGIPGTVGGAIKMNAGSFGVSVSGCLQSVRIADGDAIRVVPKEKMEFGYRQSSLRDDQCILEATFAMTDGDPEGFKADMDYLWRERWRKHPMDLPSAGSTFKNRDGVACWRFIDEAGLRGLSIGGASVSEKHPNFIVNTGKARAADVKGLIDAVKKGVREATGVALEEEVELWGFDA
jgi:UDP-N-acetylmuramate dehydrogenase